MYRPLKERRALIYLHAHTDRSEACPALNRPDAINMLRAFSPFFHAHFADRTSEPGNVIETAFLRTDNPPSLEKIFEWMLSSCAIGSQQVMTFMPFGNTALVKQASYLFQIISLKEEMGRRLYDKEMVKSAHLGKKQRPKTEIYGTAVACQNLKRAEEVLASFPASHD